MDNVIYRGPVSNEPQTVNLPVAGAYLPGVLVKSNGSTLTVATAADIEDDIHLLSNARFMGQDLATAYVSGDTGVAYKPQAGEQYQARLAGATYAANDMLTVGASGYLEKATAGERVLAFFKGTAGAVVAGTLTDVEIANSFNMA